MYKLKICRKSTSGLGSGRSTGVSGEYDEATQTYGGWEEAYGDASKSWTEYTDSYNSNVSEADKKAIESSFDADNWETFGYVRTSNAFEINQQLYDVFNDGLSDEEIFTRTDSKGELRDLQTVKALDRAIASGRVPKNAIFTRFTSYDAIRATFLLTSNQTFALKGADRLNAAELKQLSNAMKGTVGESNAFTSTSGNRQLNVFRGSPVERKLYVPKGTKAYAVSWNKDESEVIFGRGMKTEVIGITVAKDGHLVMHERFIGYNRK